MKNLALLVLCLFTTVLTAQDAPHVEATRVWTTGQDTVVELENEGFESGLGNFVNTGIVNWTTTGTEALEGSMSANSNVVVGGQTAILDLSLDVPAGYMASVSFYILADTTQGPDLVDDVRIGFEIDAAAQSDVLIYTNWTEKKYFISEGNHVLSWQVYHDAPGSDDQVQAWLDTVVVSYHQRPALRMADGSEGFGKILVSDAHGNASWKHPDELISYDNPDATFLVPLILDGRQQVEYPLTIVSGVAAGVTSENNGLDGFFASNNGDDGFTAYTNTDDGFSSGSNGGHGFYAEYNGNDGFNAFNNTDDGFTSRFNGDDGFNAEENANNGYNAFSNGGNGFNAEENGSNGFNAEDNAGYGFYARNNGSGGFLATGGFFSVGFFAQNILGIGFVSSGHLSDGYDANNNGDDGFDASNNTDDGFYAANNGGHGFLAYSNGNDGFNAHDNTDDGVVARGNGDDGIYSFNNTGLAGRFGGDVVISGTLSKGGGSFQIDHPLDPENKFLFHSFVESPDMMNVYNGNVILDANGEVVVHMEEWFGALNRDFRYQLTCIGGFAPVYIAEKISNNQFKIAGGTPGLEVSWQVSGIRQDPFANQNRIEVEVEKPAEFKGYYLHPEAYGRSFESGFDYVKNGYKTLEELNAESETGTRRSGKRQD